MLWTLLLLLAVTATATWLSRMLASKRNRHAGLWAFATAMLPPVVLILWALPSKDAVKGAKPARSPSAAA